MKELKQLKLIGLIEQCQAQTDLYSRHEAHDTQYCLEIWRRAIMEHDEAAWEATISQYGGFVRRWIAQRLAHAPALRYEEDALVNGVFINFFRFVKPEKFTNFSSLGAVLQYLKLCCGTIVADAQRDYQARNLDTSLEIGELSPAERISSDFDLEEAVLAYSDRASFWTGVWQKLPEPTDRLLIYLRYILAMPPREITQLYPQHFENVNAVYRRNKNILWRLRHNSDLLYLS